MSTIEDEQPAEIVELVELAKTLSDRFHLRDLPREALDEVAAQRSRIIGAIEVIAESRAQEMVLIADANKLKTATEVEMVDTVELIHGHPGRSPIIRSAQVEASGTQPDA